MSKRVCPWWLGYLLASPLRRLMGNPHELLSPYVREGMMVLEPGPGMGFFTLELARLVGPSGRVVAVEIQPRMIIGLKRRLAKAGLLERTDVRAASADSMGVADLVAKIDFTLAFAVVHEMPSSRQFFTEAAAVSKPGANLLFAEPAGHVKPDEFEAELQDAAQAGFILTARPSMRRCCADPNRLGPRLAGFASHLFRWFSESRRPLCPLCPMSLRRDHQSLFHGH